MDPVVTDNEYENYEYDIRELFIENGQLPWVVDLRLQRLKRPDRVTNIARDFDPNALGVFAASQRPNGTLILLDGQHRGGACLEKHYRGPLITRVYRNLTPVQEAKLFRRLNNTAKVPRLDLFAVAQTEQAPLERKLARILEDFDLYTHQAAHVSTYTAIGAALRILAQKDGEARLRWAFEVATTAWPNQGSKAVIGGIIEGLTIMQTRYGVDAIDKASLINKISKEGTPDVVTGMAKTLRQSHKVSLPIAFARAFTNIYNHDLKKYKLQEWGEKGVYARTRTARELLA